MTQHLKRYLYICIAIFACVCLGDQPLQAQISGLKNLSNSGSVGGNMGKSSGKSSKKSKTTTEDGEDPCYPKSDKRFCYTLDPITGIEHEAVPDTTFEGLGNNETMEGRALAIAYTGNSGSPHQVESFFDRRKNHDFFFVNAYNTMRQDPSQMLYYNTRIPFTVARYSKSGSSLVENDRLKLDFAGNFNKEIGLGTNLDYTYARGTYLNSSTKPLIWKSYAYYNGEQYKAYLSFQKSKLANQENGGIVNRDHVIKPDMYEKAFTDPRTMQTRLTNAWSDNMSDQIHFQHNYVLGYWEDTTQPGDTVESERLVPVGTLFHSFDLETWKHIYRMEEGAQIDTLKLYQNYFMNDASTYDSLSYRNLSTYAGIRLNEGFSKFSQFAIAAFIGYEHQSYRMMVDSTNLDYIGRRHASNNFYAGGQLSRHLSSILTFDATAKIGISGDKAGDVEIGGVAQSVIPFGRRNAETGLRSDSLLLQVSGGFDNTHVSYLQQHYFSNHFRWNLSDKEVNPEQHTRIEGKATYPRTGTSVRAGYEVITNYHYFSAPAYQPLESDEVLNVWALELRQNLHIGTWFNWDNAVLLQTSNNDSILSLPQICIESDISLRFRIAKTLAVHLGAAGYYHTNYYAPDYMPALQQFGVQHDIKCGNFPIVNAYMNCNLKRIKFFLCLQNVLGNSVSNKTFLMPYYPIEPRRFCFGIALDLQN